MVRGYKISRSEKPKVARRESKLKVKGPRRGCRPQLKKDFTTEATEVTEKKRGQKL
jgi:hypothetical protein